MTGHFKYSILSLVLSAIVVTDRIPNFSDPYFYSSRALGAALCVAIHTYNHNIGLNARMCLVCHR